MSKERTRAWPYVVVCRTRAGNTAWEEMEVARCVDITAALDTANTWRETIAKIDGIRPIVEIQFLGDVRREA